MPDNNSNEQLLDLPSWQFRPSNLGCLSGCAGEITFKPLTIVCGHNNTGKTWVLYALYGFLISSISSRLPEIDSIAQDLEKQGQIAWDFAGWMTRNSEQIISAINQSNKKKLPAVFNSPPYLFKNSSFDWVISPEVLISNALKKGMDYGLAVGRDKNEVLRLHKKTGDEIINLTLISDTFPHVEHFLSDVMYHHLIGKQPTKSVFLMPAERNGLHLFYTELANRRVALLHHAAKKDKHIDIDELINDVIRSKYAKPIADYIDWLNELPEIRKNKGGHFHSAAEEVKQIVDGRYDVDSDGDISFTPYKLKRGDKSLPPKLDLHLTSSTVKSLFGLWAYLEFSAKPGDVLMIDEPELNLHPSNQRKLARILSHLVNSGLRVVLSTHSDYLVRELNSLIMLSRDSKSKDDLMKKYGYRNEDILDPDSVGAWLFGDRVVTKMEVNGLEGINAKTFDEEITRLNEIGDEIYYTYQDDEGL